MELIRIRITDLCHTRSSKKYFPRFSQCLVQLPAGSLAWADDPCFHMSRHVSQCHTPISDQADLEHLLKVKAEEGLQVDRPLWHLTIASGWCHSPGCRYDAALPSAISCHRFVLGYGGHNAKVLIWRFHGSVYDGVTIAKVLSYALTNPKIMSFKPNTQSQLYGSHIARVRECLDSYPPAYFFLL